MCWMFESLVVSFCFLFLYLTLCVIHYKKSPAGGLGVLSFLARALGPVRQGIASVGRCPRLCWGMVWSRFMLEPRPPRKLQSGRRRRQGPSWPRLRPLLRRGAPVGPQPHPSPGQLDVASVGWGGWVGVGGGGAVRPSVSLPRVAKTPVQSTRAQGAEMRRGQARPSTGTRWGA